MIDDSASKVSSQAALNHVERPAPRLYDIRQQSTGSGRDLQTIP